MKEVETDLGGSPGQVWNSPPDDRAGQGMKKGINSTEFWMPLVVSVLTLMIGALVANGLLTNEDLTVIAQIVGGLVTLAATVAPGLLTARYIDSRTVQKLQAADFARSNQGVNSTGAGSL